MERPGSDQLCLVAGCSSTCRGASSIIGSSMRSGADFATMTAGVLQSEHHHPSLLQPVLQALQ
jgi:hypothetical protein